MAEGKVTLKLVKGERYMSPLFGDGVIVEKDQTVEVDAEQAHFLTEDKWVDALGNEHFYFEEVEGEDGKPSGRRSRKPAPVAPEGEGDK